MYDVIVRPAPPRALLAALATAGLMLLLLWLVAFDQGQLSGAGSLLHELLHDGRHLLGVPCH